MGRGKYYASLTVTLGLFLIFLVAFTIYTSRRQVSLSLASGQDAGAYFPLAESIASLIQRTHPRIKISVLQSDGSRDNARRIIAGEADVGLIQNDTEGDESLRSLVPLHQGALHFLVRRNSKIKSLADLENHRIGIGLESSGSHQLVHALLKHFELDMNKIDLVPVSIQDGCTKLESGNIDALLLVLSLKTPALDKLFTNNQVDLIGIGRHSGKGSVIDGFRLGYPFAEPYLIPRFAYAAPHGDQPGIPNEPVPTLSVPTILVSHRDLPDSVAREITKSVIENRKALTSQHLGAAMLDTPVDTDQLQFPLHDGAAAYFRRNEPGFLVRYAEVIALILSLLATTYAVSMAGKRWFIQRQKDRIDAYYLQLNDLLKRLAKTETSEELHTIESELQDIRSTALTLLARERLIPNESFRIFQSLLSEAAQESRQKRLALNLTDS